MSLVELAPKREAVRYRESDVKIDGKNVHYLRVGDPSAPKIILNHGIISTAAICFKEAIGLMAEKGFDVIAPDLPGYGQSDSPDRYSTVDYIWGFIDFMDALGIERAHAGGVSFGGSLATGAAILRHERIDKLLLIDSWGFEERLNTPYVDHFVLGRTITEFMHIEKIAAHLFSHSIVSQAFLGMKHILEKASPVVKKIAKELANRRIANHDYFDDRDMDIMSEDKAWRTVFEWLKTEIGPTGPRTNFLPILSRVFFHHPTLILKGEKDHLISSNSAERAHNHIEGSRLVVFEGVKHGGIPIQEAPKFASIATEFLKQHSPALALSA